MQYYMYVCLYVCSSGACVLLCSCIHSQCFGLQLFLANHCYSNLYGTFTGESEKERQDHNVYTRTKFIWSALEDNQMMFMNFVYSKSIGKKVRTYVHMYCIVVFAASFDLNGL